MLTGIDYASYFQGAQFIHFLLGPATVALAIPLFDHRERVRRLWRLRRVGNGADGKAQRLSAAVDRQPVGALNGVA